MSDDAQRHAGKVKWFSQPKGYGFIMPADGGDDIFVHFNELRGVATLAVDQAVTFELATDAKKGNGKRARSVRLEG